MVALANVPINRNMIERTQRRTNNHPTESNKQRESTAIDCLYITSNSQHFHYKRKTKPQ